MSVSLDRLRLLSDLCLGQKCGHFVEGIDHHPIAVVPGCLDEGGLGVVVLEDAPKGTELMCYGGLITCSECWTALYAEVHDGNHNPVKCR